MAESEELVKNERDWSDLPPDIIHFIAKKLPDLLEFVCFRAFCQSWRSSATLSNRPQQMPWLLEFSSRDISEPVQFRPTPLRLYSITSGKTVTIPMNKAGWFIGASCHYLPYYDDRKDVLSLFNPLTQKEIVYPPINTYTLLSPWMVWTNTSPILDRNILIVDRGSYPNGIGRWALYDAKDEMWTKEEGFFYNFCYCKGKLISTSCSFDIDVTDISTKKLLYKVPHPEDGYHNMRQVWTRRTYLVESSGEVWAVYWFQPQQDKSIKKSIFDILKLDFEAEDGQGQPCWVRVHDIGDRIIFLEVRNGFSITAAPSNTGFKRGCIYFIKPSSGEPYVYHFVTGSVEKVPCPFRKCTWFLPGLS